MSYVQQRAFLRRECEYCCRLRWRWLLTTKYSDPGDWMCRVAYRCRSTIHDSRLTRLAEWLRP